MKPKVKTIDIVSTYYKVINGDPQFEDYEYQDPDEALSIANESKGNVIKILKRTVQTIEFEKIS